jgi:hypothetical protein
MEAFRNSSKVFKSRIDRDWQTAKITNISGYLSYEKVLYHLQASFI